MKRKYLENITNEWKMEKGILLTNKTIELMAKKSLY